MANVTGVLDEQEGKNERVVNSYAVLGDMQY
jgi:hypothetical protein